MSSSCGHQTNEMNSCKYAGIESWERLCTADSFAVYPFLLLKFLSCGALSKPRVWFRRFGIVRRLAASTERGRPLRKTVRLQPIRWEVFHQAVARRGRIPPEDLAEEGCHPVPIEYY